MRPEDFSSGALDQQRLDQFHHFAENLAGHDQSGNVVLALLVALPDDPHALVAIFKNLQRVAAGSESFMHQFKHGVFFQIGE